VTHRNQLLLSINIYKEFAFLEKDSSKCTHDFSSFPDDSYIFALGTTNTNKLRNDA
jgi:hypothetical protein